MNVPAGKTLLVKGPASIKLVSGSGTVFGYPLSHRKPLSVRSWRSIPVYTESGMEIEVTLGEGASIEVLDHDTIPLSWRKLIVDRIKGKSKIMVMGRTDSGKTSLSTYILNNLVLNGIKVCVVDLDSGQSNICPPTTIGMTITMKPTSDLYNLSANYIAPIGMTSPSSVMNYHLSKAGEIAKMVSGEDLFVLVDCDGWMDGEGAIIHKSSLLTLFNPSLVIFLGNPPTELEDFCKMKKIDYEVLEKPEQVYRRDMDTRKKLRESAYRKYLRDASVRVIPTSWMDVRSLTYEVKGIEEDPISYVNKILQAYSLHTDRIPPVTLDEIFKQRLGLLSYLLDANGRCMGIGLLSDLDIKKNITRIFTKVDAVPKKLIIGCMVLSYNGDETFVYRDI